MWRMSIRSIDKVGDGGETGLTKEQIMKARSEDKKNIVQPRVQTHDR